MKSRRRIPWQCAAAVVVSVSFVSSVCGGDRRSVVVSATRELLLGEYVKLYERLDPIEIGLTQNQFVEAMGSMDESAWAVVAASLALESENPFPKSPPKFSKESLDAARKVIDSATLAVAQGVAGDSYSIDLTRLESSWPTGADNALLRLVMRRALIARVYLQPIGVPLEARASGRIVSPGLKFIANSSWHTVRATRAGVSSNPIFRCELGRDQSGTAVKVRGALLEGADLSDLVLQMDVTLFDRSEQPIDSRRHRVDCDDSSRCAAEHTWALGAAPVDAVGCKVHWSLVWNEAEVAEAAWKRSIQGRERK